MVKQKQKHMQRNRKLSSCFPWASPSLRLQFFGQSDVAETVWRSNCCIHSLFDPCALPKELGRWFPNWAFSSLLQSLSLLSIWCLQVLPFDLCSALKSCFWSWQAWWFSSWLAWPLISCSEQATFWVRRTIPSKLRGFLFWLGFRNRKTHRKKNWLEPIPKLFFFSKQKNDECNE